MNPPPTPTLPWAKPWLGFLAFFAAYAALYSHPHFNLPLPPWMIPVFPGTSLVVAALLLTPARYWPLLLTGSGLIAIACNLFLRQLDWTLDLVRVVANVAQAAVTAWLTRRFCGGAVDLERMPHIVTLTISGILGTLTAAIPLWFLVAPALPRGELNLPLARFASHLLGTSVLTVLVITWVPALLRLPRWRWQRVLEAGVLLLFSLGVFHLAFRSTTDDLSTFAAPYLALLPVLVAAVRFGAPGTAGLMALLAVETIAAVGRGYGWPEGGTLYERLAAAQLSLAATAVTALLLAAYVAGTERALRLASEREFRIRSLFEHMRDAVCAVREGLIVLVNPEFVRLFGQKHEADLVGKPLTDLVAPADRERLQLALQAAASDVTPAPSVTVQGLAGRESTVPVEARLSGYEANDVPVVLVSFRDVTELERSEQLARRSNRVLRVVSACDRVLVGASAEAGVLSEICRAATAEAGYRFAWIGFVNHDEEKTVVPMASAGFEEGYLVRSPITWRPDRPEGRGPCGQCVRSGRPFVCRDTAHDPNYAPWRDEAIRRGYRSSVALPLVADGWVFGVFNLYSDFADDFGPDELPLLQQMTSSLASTITALRAREKQKETEAEVRRLLEEAENARGALLSILEDEQRAQAERLRSEDRYHNAIVNSAIGMAMVSPEGHWLDVNPAFCRMVGHTAEELLGRNADEVTHPADRAAGARRRERLAAGSDTSFVAEKRLLHKSGRIVWVQLSVSRVEPDGPDSRRVFCQIQDITARKLAEESLSAVAERLALALRASKFGVWRFNLQMQITEWDTRMFAIFGFPPSAVVPPLEAILARVADEDREAVRRSWSGSPACDRSYSMRFRVVWPDKQVRHVDLQGIVHDDAFGRPEWTIGVAGDITDIIEATSESERLRAQLQQARKMEALGNMAAGVAHDFNNLLTGINGFVELASTTLPDGHEANKLLERAKKGAISARDLVRRILNFSRNSNEQTRTQVDLLGIVRDTAPLIVAAMPSNVSVSIAAQCDKAIVFADIGQIQQVLMNLCTNAAHAIDQRPGKIEIGVARCEIGANEHPSIPRGCSAGPYVRLWVKDTGCGMDEATLRRIFEPFFTTKKQGEGTGLGLPIVNDIVNAHDGGLDVASVVGCGTTFSLYFPLLPEEAPSAEPAAGFPPTTGAGQRILVVDDEASVGMIVRLVLQRNGYQPELYSAPRDAWKRLQEDPLRFQLLIIDQNMPETTGTKFIQQAREIAPDLPVILMSGRFESTNEMDGLEPAGVSRLKKPFELADLAAAVAAGLEWRRAPAASHPRSAP